jgi:FKBP-type peptidyl-prolyl cis-trans isomerase
MIKHTSLRALTVALAALMASLPAVYAQNATVTAATPAAAPADAAPAAPTPPTPDQIKAFFQAYGWILGIQVAGVKQLNLTPDEIDDIAAGMKLAATTADIPGGKDAAMKMQAYLASRAESVLKDETAKQSAIADKFFAALAKDPTILKTADGLYYKINVPGGADKPGATDTVSVKYTGALTDGSVFDKTTPDDPVRDFELDHVFPGWAEGIQLIGKGGNITLYIPGALGAGEQGQGPIPPNAPLVFNVELVDFKPTPPPASSGSSGLPAGLMDSLQQGGAGAAPPPSGGP